MSRFPFPIPNSWYLVSLSQELASGEARSLRYFDRDLVLFRGESGRAAVLDAHCPHLGAHLGVGGRVVGDAIECPFHAWQWSGEGRCLAIPYAKRIPSQARTVSYPVVERNGMIFVWFHAEAEPPSFEIPEIPEWGRSDWLGSWIAWDWTLQSCPQEIAENGIDWPHFRTVHLMDMPEDHGAEFGESCFKWQVGGRKAVSTLAGRSDELMMHGENWGMGYSWLRQRGEFDTIVATGLTPIDRETTQVRMAVIARIGDRAEGEARKEVEAYMAEHAVFAEQDFNIWAHKKFRPKPLLCEEDGPITEYRRWAAQFY
ncbi:MAG: Rieske 2Fe-2S domain-containing protein [Deltaproteobacteria bacterium]|jgi:phenylpropionate dioxygenase-like ring-hydroxylating dioxygenase large terminal subunit|nr:Rieske 2Fe-2S domain-containing protein [Deltaproteobacteria bacterium]